MADFNRFFKFFLIFRQKILLFTHKMYYMVSQFNLKNYNKIHFIGVGGISVSALAKFCIFCGKKVSGSDNSCSNEIKSLQNLGLTFYLGHRKENLKAVDLVVYTSAVKENNPELVEARKMQIPILKRSELLGQISSLYSKSIAVCGSHGKTTATAMLSDVFILAGKSPTVFLGGNHSCFSNFRMGEGDTVILEACEYKKNFLDVYHTLSLVLNIDNDHADSYRDIDEQTDAFNKFLGSTLGVINADDVYARKLFNNSTVTFGIKNPATFTAKRIKYNGEGYSFTFYAYGKKMGRVALKIAGKHNVYNALGCLSVANLFGIDFKTSKSALENYKGVKRRNEVLGKIDGVTAVADYAHHPQELRSSLLVNEDEKSNALVVFQPHTYSRTQSLMDDFINALSPQNNLIIYKTYPAREGFLVEGDGKTLWENIKRKNPLALYSDSAESLYQQIKQVILREKIDKILFLGAGDIYDIACKLVVSSDMRMASCLPPITYKI